MPVSLASQLTAIAAVHDLRPADLVRAGITRSPAQAQLLCEQLRDAYLSFQTVASDERIRRYLEKALK